MASGNFDLDKGYRAAEALTKFKAVVFTDTEEVGPVAADTDVVAGWVQFSVTTAELARGKGASIRMMGITEAVAKGAIDVGNMCTLTAAGEAKAATSGDRVVGMCVGHASTNDGDRISLLITPVGHIAP